MERKGGRREKEASQKEFIGTIAGSGGAGINEDISAMEADVQLSKRIQHNREPDGSVDRGISMTVPDRSIFAVESICSTRMPGRKSSVTVTCRSRYNEQKRLPSYLRVGYTKKGR
jgi:hypothetical protein